jgi:guanine nucleotide-binding protein subunit alpha
LVCALGTIGSGKSTILKQMRLTHARKFTDLERESHRVIIFTNLLHSMRLILEVMERDKIEFDNPENTVYLSLFSQVPAIKRNEPYPHDYQIALCALWTDRNVHACLHKANECAINDSVE